MSFRALSLLPLLPSALAASSLLVSHFEGTLYSLTLDDAASSLTISGQVSTGGGMPSWLTLDREAGKVYVTDEAWFGTTTLTTYAVTADGALTKGDQTNTPGGELHSCLYGGSDGKGFIAAAQYNGGALINYKLPISPSSPTPIQHLKYTMSGPGPKPDRQDAPHIHSTFTDPSGRFLLAADLGADVVRIFSIDADSGRLTECPAAATAPGDGPRHGAFWSPSDAAAGDSDINVLYTVNELGNSVTGWSVAYPEAGGCLTLTRGKTIATLPAGKNPPPGSKASEIRVRDNFIYASNRFDKSFGQNEDSIATYEIDPATGEFSFVEITSAFASFPRSFDINGDGTMVAIGGQTSSNVAIVERDPATGRLGGLLANLAVGRPGAEMNEDGLSAVIWNE